MEEILETSAILVAAVAATTSVTKVTLQASTVRTLPALGLATLSKEALVVRPAQTTLGKLVVGILVVRPTVETSVTKELALEPTPLECLDLQMRVHTMHSLLLVGPATLVAREVAAIMAHQVSKIEKKFKNTSQATYILVVRVS